jgi:ribonuclease R
VALQTVIAKFGYKIDLRSKDDISKSLNSLLSEVVGKKEQNLVDTLTIRTMSKAKYSTDNIGHYGLAFDYYSHFTSPIRRYPTLWYNRLLPYYLDGGKSADEESMKLNVYILLQWKLTSAERIPSNTCR